MNNELTPEQNGQLKTWVGKRDSILAEIAVAQSSLEGLTSKNKNFSDSNTDIQTRIHQSQGRLDEMTKKEEEYTLLVNAEIPILESKKTFLETRIADLEKMVLFLTAEKDSLLKTIDSLSNVHDRVFDRASELDKKVSEVIQINYRNIQDIENFMISLKNSVAEIIKINQENVKAGNQMVTELPRVFFELKRKHLPTQQRL